MNQEPASFGPGYPPGGYGGPPGGAPPGGYGPPGGGGYGPPGGGPPGGGGYGPPGGGGYGGPPPGGFGGPPGGPPGFGPPGGFPPPGMGPMGPQQSVSSGLAIAGLVCGILSIPGICCCGGGIPFGIAGAVMGGIAMSKAKSSPETHGGGGMGLAGMICGIIGAVLSVVYLIIYGATMAAGNYH